MRKSYRALQTEVNRSVLRIAYKEYLAKKIGICTRCPYHKGIDNRRHTDSKSWKRYRKTQYRAINSAGRMQRWQR